MGAHPEIVAFPPLLRHLIAVRGGLPLWREIVAEASRARLRSALVAVPSASPAYTWHVEVLRPGVARLPHLQVRRLPGRSSTVTGLSGSRVEIARGRNGYVRKMCQRREPIVAKAPLNAATVKRVRRGRFSSFSILCSNPGEPLPTIRTLSTRTSVVSLTNSWRRGVICSSATRRVVSSEVRRAMVSMSSARAGMEGELLSGGLEVWRFGGFPLPPSTARQ